MFEVVSYITVGNCKKVGWMIKLKKFPGYQSKKTKRSRIKQKIKKIRLSVEAQCPVEAC